MTSLDARALKNDREGLAFLGAVIGTSAEMPSIEARFGIAAPLAKVSKRRRDPSVSGSPSPRKRAVRAAS